MRVVGGIVLMVIFAAMIGGGTILAIRTFRKRP